MKGSKRRSGWYDLFPVYDIDGPRIRLGVGWFLLAAPAVILSLATIALLYGVVGGLAARQVVKAWNGSRRQADVAGPLVAVPVLATIFGLEAGLATLVVALVIALVVGWQEPAGGLRGGSGRLAGGGIMVQAVGPMAVAGGSMVLLANQNAVVAGMLFLMACAYEVGDFIIGSGGVTPVEGPIAGGLAMALTGFPAALMFLEPFDVMAVWLLGVAALTAMFGQWVASALLPKPDAHAPALRRMDTLLVLAPLWVAAAGAF